MQDNSFKGRIARKILELATTSEERDLYAIVVQSTLLGSIDVLNYHDVVGYIDKKARMIELYVRQELTQEIRAQVDRIRETIYDKEPK